MIPALAYLRVSTFDQKDSLATQRAAVLREAAHRDVTIADDAIFHDEDVSGGTPFLERPGVARLMEHAMRTGIRQLYITKVDRAFRDVGDCAFTVRPLLRNGWQIRFLDFFGQELDLGTAMGEMMLGMAVLVAQFERRRLAERIKENAAGKKARGELAGNVPYGADRVPSPHRKTKNLGADRQALYGDAAFDLVPNDAEQLVLARLRTGDLSCLADNEAARRLNAEGTPAKKGGKWYGASARGVKRNGWTPLAVAA